MGFPQMEQAPTMRKASLALAVVFAIARAVQAQSDKPAAIEILHARAPEMIDSKTVNVPVYMTIRNGLPRDERLLGASTPYADRVDLIELRNEFGLTLPMAAAVLRVAPGASLDLNPLGPRLPLSGCKTLLTASETFPLTLMFEQSGPIEVEVMVEGASSRQPHRH
jgi:copper(I)-binding protein